MSDDLADDNPYINAWPWTLDEYREKMKGRKRPLTDDTIRRHNVAPVVDITRRTLIDDYTADLGGDAA